MHILFPSLPIAPSTPDPDFAVEYRAAQAAGFSCSLYELEALRADDMRAALKYCRPPVADDEMLIYRGWMVNDTHYAKVYHALIQRGYQPITTPSAYAEAHYLPYAYQHLSTVTPQTVWMEGVDRDTAWSLYQRLADGPVILKDYVKSAKHRWREACFLPVQTARADFDRIVTAFLVERGDLFEKGLVFRRYHPLVQLGETMWGQPIHEEYRLFCLDGTIIAHPPFARPDNLNHQQQEWEAIAARFANRFVTLDVARQDDGSWIVVEVGDGGVSGLALSIDPTTFYHALWDALQSQNRT